MSKRKATDSPGPVSKMACRKVLTLHDKVAVCKALDAGKSHRQIACDFEVGKTQIGNIAKQRDNIMVAFEAGAVGHRKYLSPKHQPYEKLNEQVMEFFYEARAKHMPIEGKHLKREGQKIAMKLGYDNFCASNGWLRSLCSRHQLKYANLHGESADVDHEACDKWVTDVLPGLLQGYTADKIFNVDEIGIFYRRLPTKSYIGPNEKAK